jgi:Domain of unknown function (DUF4115)
MRFFEKLTTPIAVVVVLVFFLVVDGFLFYRYQQSLTESLGTVYTTTTEEEAKYLQVDVRVVDELAWLRIQEDGWTVLEQESPPGFSRRFEANREVRVQTDNAGATWVEANGQEIGALGDSGQAETWTFGIRPES